MTKKDYEAIARVFEYARTFPPNASAPLHIQEYRRGHEDARRTLATDLCDVFATDNPRFDRARFLKSCGVQE